MGEVRDGKTMPGEIARRNVRSHQNNFTFTTSEAAAAAVAVVDSKLFVHRPAERAHAHIAII